RALMGRLLMRGHGVRVLTRPGSQSKVPVGAIPVIGNALDAASFSDALNSSDTFVQLTGVAHPAPWKEAQFRAIDQVSLNASAANATAAKVEHFVYVSVAQPAPVMRSYIQVRQECEATLAATGLRQTILRPWYILGPGHWWPVALKPIYAALEALPSTRESARRLGLVTLDQMADALLWAVENPPESRRVLDVPAIRNCR
ncbi:MAG: SDR family oxidoreductase, partial [Acidobacteriota bacterium]